MSRARVGMTLLLLGAVAACGTSDGGNGPASQSFTSHREESGQGRSGEAHRGARATETTVSSASSPPTVSAPPPYISRVVWVLTPSGRRSLQVYPTANGRTVTGDSAEGEAWREVLRKAPDAGSQGMRAQFDCHWVFARLAEPNKPSWNLEPWRPVVTGQQMYDARCNPGGPEV
ncbi:MAG TPA: DUF2599 domain-containing protein [Flexivirga sp.]|uniref:DUF2599 domain-containing protein n=1 Tax=Flexivirga sp. TaxID=1962927 RepID=UPI002CDA40AB|nr:DUF2599 domain-containing protein [Flexivirga sp.]HWC21230.1 DUF2599 domain-containing protein [Flexivirga sp.]